MAKKRKSKRKTTKASNARRSTVLGVFLMIAAGTSLAALFYLYYLNKKANARDSFGCLQEHKANHRIVLFDKSDALNPVQKKSVRSHFDDLIFRAPVNTLFSIYVLDTNTMPTTKLLVKKCKPKSGQQVNALTENERLVEENWQNKFVIPVNSAIDQLLLNNPSDQSPIMEAIQAVSLDSFDQDHGDISITIVSDMIQNTAGLNQYSEKVDFAPFRTSSYYQEVRSDLGGASVEILYVGRSSRREIQTNRHGNFWASYIDSMNASLERIERLIGE